MMFSILLCIYVLLHVGQHVIYCSQWQEVLPWHVKSTLLDVHEDFNIHNITDNPTPIYRTDISTHEVAYWEIHYNNAEFIILAAGPFTGDHRLIYQGKQSPLKELNQAATRNGTRCLKYYIISPSPGFMFACKDERDLLVLPHDDIDYDEDRIASAFVNQKRLVGKKNVWALSNTNAEEEGYMYYHLIKPGDSKRVLVGDSMQADIEVQSTNSRDSQKKACDILGICLADNINHLNPKAVESTQYGQLYVNIHIPHGAVKHNGKQDSIHLEINTRDGHSLQRTNLALDLTTRSKREAAAGETFGTDGEYVLDLKTRSKREVADGETFGIEDENVFPDYDQQKMSKCTTYLFWTRCKSCMVGCGPVAWAMIFGYFDRRSHFMEEKYGAGSQSLFTCGKTGMYGNSSCIAPGSYTDISGRRQVAKYTEELRESLETFCLSGEGATFTSKMDKVDVFFKKYQKSGNPTITTHSNGFWSLIGNYNDGIRDKAIEYLKKKWPVVVGIRIDGSRFGQHYPVATQVRGRRATVRRCTLGLFNCKDVIITENDFFLHWGWGVGVQNSEDVPNWVPAEVFFAGAATY